MTAFRFSPLRTLALPGPTRLRLGPLVGYEQGDHYTVSILTDSALNVCPVLNLCSGASMPFTAAIATPSGRFWRVEIILVRDTAPQTIRYHLTAGQAVLSDQAGRQSWLFHVPGLGERTRLAYAPCHDFPPPDPASLPPEFVA